MNKLKLLRIKKKLSQYKMALLTDMSQAKFSCIERGDLRPNPLDQKKIASVLNINPNKIWSVKTNKIKRVLK